MLKNIVLVSLSMCSVLAFADSKPEPVAPLAECITNDQESFKINDMGNGQVSVNGKVTSIVSIEINDRHDHSILFSLSTAAGNYIRIKQDNEGALSYYDRGAIGGLCKIGGGVNSHDWNNLALKSKEISKQTWKLAVCSKPGQSEMTVTYHKGFVPGQVIISGLSEDARDFSYVAKSTSSDGGLGHIQQYFIGEGHTSYFGLGHHVQPIQKTLTLDYNSRNGSQDPQSRMGSIDVGQEQLDADMSRCTISNLWHIQSLVSPE